MEFASQAPGRDAPGPRFAAAKGLLSAGGSLWHLLFAKYYRVHAQGTLLTQAFEQELTATCMNNCLPRFAATGSGAEPT